VKVSRGHIRISCGPDRGKYEHRVIIRDLLRVWNFWGYSDIPPGYSVHHLDFREDHNCPYNLLFLDHTIHQAFIVDYRKRHANGHWAPQHEEPEAPSWVTMESEPYGNSISNLSSPSSQPEATY
jgi:hypothetical protein